MNTEKMPDDNKVTFHAISSSFMPEFNAESDEWPSWIERLEHHFVEVGCTDDNIKKSSLLKHVGATAYSLLRTLCDPAAPGTKSYTDLCDLLKLHYTPSFNTLQ